MRRAGSLALAAAVLSFVACSAELIGTPSDDPPDGGGDGGLDEMTTPRDDAGVEGGVDAGGDSAPTPRCTPQSPLDKIVPLELASEVGFDDRHPTLNDAETELFFASTRSGQGRYPTIYRVTRVGSGTFGDPAPALPPQPAGAVLVDSHGSLSPDGLSLVFATKRDIASTFDIWIARRAGLGISFVTADPVTSGVNDVNFDENSPTIDSAGVLWFARTVSAGGGGGALHQVIYTAQPKPSSPSWMTVVEETALNHPELSTGKAVLSADRLTLYFATNRAHAATPADYDIWSATRTSTGSAFGDLALVTDLATSEYEVPGWVSADGCRLYFDRGGANGARIYVAVRTP